MTLTEWADRIHQNAVNHGWWEEERAFCETIALCHSELSEALEEFRNNTPKYYIADGKPEGIYVELIDCIIRILDYLGHEKANVDELMKIKHDYNVTRPYKHGNKVI
jgi:hypothetical protein